MTAALIAYAIVAAMVVGWLLAEATRPGPDGGVPLYIFILLPVLWLPVAAGVVILLLWAVVALWIRGKGYWA